MGRITPMPDPRNSFLETTTCRAACHLHRLHARLLASAQSELARFWRGSSRQQAMVSLCSVWLPCWFCNTPP